MTTPVGGCHIVVGGLKASPQRLKKKKKMLGEGVGGNSVYEGVQSQFRPKEMGNRAKCAGDAGIRRWVNRCERR